MRRTREVVAGETRWSRRGARSFTSLPPFLLGLGIGVGKGWEVVLEYGIGEKRGVPKRHTWVPNIKTITYLRVGEAYGPR